MHMPGGMMEVLGGDVAEAALIDLKKILLGFVQWRARARLAFMGNSAHSHTMCACSMAVAQHTANSCLDLKRGQTWYLCMLPLACWTQSRLTPSRT